MTKTSKIKTNKPIANGHGGFLTGQLYEIFVGTEAQVEKISKKLGYSAPFTHEKIYGKAPWLLVNGPGPSLRWETHVSLWYSDRALYTNACDAAVDALNRADDIRVEKIKVKSERKAAKNGLTLEEENLIRRYSYARKFYFKNQGRQVDHILKIKKRHELTDRLLKMMALPEEELLENEDTVDRLENECRNWDVDAAHLVTKMRWLKELNVSKDAAETALAKCSPEILEKYGL